MTSLRPSRAARTIDEMLARILAHDMVGYARLWAVDGTMDFPFATGSSPSHLGGRAAVAEYVAGYNDLLRPDTIVFDRRHQTEDPDTVVVEFGVSGEVVATGGRYQLDYVAVVTVSDRGIVSYRDYWSPVAVHDVMGRQDLRSGPG